MAEKAERPPRGRASSERALIDAAIELVIESGVHAVSVRAIADRAGVNHGLVHHYFGSKAGLINAALADVIERANALLADQGPASVVSPDFSIVRQSMNYLGRLIVEDALPADVPQQFPMMDRLAAIGMASGLDAREARIRAAQVMSLFMGWFMLEPWLLVAIGDDIDDIDALRQHLVGAGRRVGFGQ